MIDEKSKYTKENIGEKHLCEVCGETEGEVTFDPYDEEIHGEETIVCLCKGCWRDSWENT